VARRTARKPHELLNLARDGKIELAISDAILDEFSRILHDKLEWSDDRLNSMRAEIATFTKRVSSTAILRTTGTSLPRQFRGRRLHVRSRRQLFDGPVCLTAREKTF